MTTTRTAPYDAVLLGGGLVRIRQIEEADRPSLQQLLNELSERTAYQRFFTAGLVNRRQYLEKILSDEHLIAVLAIEHDTPVALASLHLLDNGCGEVALVVSDGHQGEGIGTLLLEDLAARARALGVETLSAVVLPDNQQMIDLFGSAGFGVRTDQKGDLLNLECPLIFGADAVSRIVERDRLATVASLKPLLTPGSVVVIGAGHDPNGVGHRVADNLASGGYRGQLAVVNRSGHPVGGIPGYRTVAEVPGDIDLAVVAVPADCVLDVARACADRGVRAMLVISAGFAETGVAGRERQDELLDVCRAAGMRLAGPNCLGLVNTDDNSRLNATFMTTAPDRGAVGVMTQSGAVGAAALAELRNRGIGISTFASVGNKADVSGNDLLQMWDSDDATSVIALYLESFGNPRKFAAIASRVSRHKPIVAIKAGRTPEGDTAVRSHTAAAAAPDTAVDALFDRTGVVRVPSLRELADVVELLLAQPLPRGRRVAVVGNSGGPGALAIDECALAKLVPATFTPATVARLTAGLPPAASTGDPVDITASGDVDALEHAISTVAADPTVDCVIVVVTPLPMLPAHLAADAIGRCALSCGKPVVASFLATAAPRHPGVTAYALPEDAVRALAHAADYAEWLDRPPVTVPDLTGVASATARSVVRTVLDETPAGRWLTFRECEELVHAYGVHTASSIGVDSPEGAVEAAGWLGLPVVLKGEVSGVVHKSDVGAVEVGLTTPEEVRRAYRAMQERFGDTMRTAIVQPMVRGIAELIVGAINQTSFGPLVMVGSGGVLSGLVDDHAWALPPLSEAEAKRMLGSLRCAPLLHGYRGRPPVAEGAVVDMLVRVARLAYDLPELAELDINPVIVGEHSAVAVDVRIRIAPSQEPPSFGYVRRLRS